MKKIILSLLFVSFLITSSFAQEKGFVRGNVVDGDFGGGLIGATITVKEKPGVGTITDFDGNYSLSLEPGTYTVVLSYVSYATQEFPNTEVKAGEVTIIDAILTSDQTLETVEVTAEVRRNTETAMLMDMRKSNLVMDGLSSQTFRKVGDTDLGGAIKRVTGVTVQDGKYVYVRGLGDRYTKTLLNGMEIPGLDPDNNSVQIDIFPTSVLENVAVFKTFSADLVGDFTGGLVNVVTKDFPDEKVSSVSLGITFIPEMHLNNEYINYEGGGLDFTGYDDGTRELPIDPQTDVPVEVLNNPELERITRSFDPEMATQTTTSMPNASFTFNHGNQKETKNEGTVGYNTVFRYSNQRVFYRDFESNDYLKDQDLSETELFRQVVRKGDVGKSVVNWSGLLSGAYKINKSSFNATLLHSVSSESTAAKRFNRDVEQNQATLEESILTYTQRTLSTLLLSYEQQLGKVKMKLANASSLSRVYDPDFRETRISITDGDTTLATGEGAGIDRFWRDLNEFNNSTRLDFEIPIKEESAVFDDLKLKTGGIASYKYRDFSTNQYKFRRNNLSDVSIDPDWYFREENFWSTDPNNPSYLNGTYAVGNFQDVNQFEAQQLNIGGYLMTTFKFMSLLDVNVGVRVEKIDMYYTGANRAGRIFNDTNTLDELNILPSLNLTFRLGDDMNIRAAASQTVARPSFKEKSGAEIYDPITKRTFIGNIDLEQTLVQNYDLRWEWFMTPRELISVAAFYKRFDGHIELVSFPTAPDNLSPRNSGIAQLYGVEFEIRKALSTSEEGILRNFFLGANVSLVQSLVDLERVIVDDDGKTEADLREDFARLDASGNQIEDIDRYRPMAGQSPYAINGNITYESKETGTSVSVAYNVQGEQLSIIASGRVPDVYTIPFHSLNFNASQDLGAERSSQISFAVRNILNDDRTMVYRSYEAEDQVYTTFLPGVQFRLKYTYNF